MKTYILIRDDIPMGKALVAAAHASLAGYLKFKGERILEYSGGPKNEAW